MDELQKLLENAGVAEAYVTSPGFSGSSKDDTELDWGDEMIEDLKLLIKETPSGKISHADLQAVIQQYEA